MVVTTPFLLGVLAGCSVVRVVARLSSSSLEMNGAREPCSERKFQSHPTVPPGRLNELAFAAVYREWGVRCELLWGVEPHDIPNGEQQGSRMREHGPPPPDRRVGVHQAGAPGCPGRACSRKGDLEGVSLRAKQPRRGGSQLWCLTVARWRQRACRSRGARGASARISAECKVELREPAI